MRTIWRLVSTLACSGTLLASLPVAAATDGPIESFMSSAEAKANNVVREAGAQGKGVAMEAGQAALNAIRLFRHLYGDALTQTVDQLSGERAALFREIQKTTSALDATSSSTIAGLQQATDSLADTTAQVIGSRAFPRIRTVTPLFMVAGDATKPEFSVRGLFLAQGKPSLDLQGRRTAPRTAIDTELRFEIPVVDSSITKPVVVPATLTVYEHIARRWWFDALEPKTYPLSLAVFPRAIGPAALTPLLAKSFRQEQPFVGPEIRCDSPRGSGTSTKPFSYPPSEGFAIDPKSVKFVRHYANHGTHSFSSLSTGELYCEGFGKNLIDEGQNGVITGHVEFTEFKMVSYVETGTPITFTFSWGDSRVEQLPQDAVGVKFTVTPTFTNQRVEALGPGQSRFAVIDFDPRTRTAQVRAKPIDEALRAP